MLLPHALYVTIVIALSVLCAGFLVWVLFKAIPGSRKSTRGCLGSLLFVILFFAVMISGMWYLPQSTIIMAGPDKEHSRKVALFTKPDKLPEVNNMTDFEMGKTYVLNRSDRSMIIHPAVYGAVTDSTSTIKIIEIPPHKLTDIENTYIPDFYFEESDATTVKEDGTTVQQRWILDYAPLNP